MAEDMSSRVGAFGDDVAVTPNLDQLADEGVRYTNVFTTAGVCAPSRAAMVLGMHQISTGAQHMRTSSRPEGGYWALPPEEVKAFPELMRQAGYYTYTDSKLDYQFSTAFAGSGPFTIWNAEGVTERGWSKRAGDQPFFGWRNFLVSHESGVFSPIGSFPHSLTHFLMQFYRWRQLGSVEEAVLPDDVTVPPYYPDTETVRVDLARHYNNIAAMDRQVGDILDKLEEDGLADSTIVIWTTDHGDGLPRAKRELYDSGIRVPMIVRWPEKFRPAGVAPGSVDERLVSAVDFAPTILGLAGTALPDYLHGESFLTSTRSFILASRDRIDEIPDRQRAIADGQFKYIRSWHPDLAQGHPLNFRDNIDMVREMRTMFEAGELDEVQAGWFLPVGEERLFDVTIDPHEINNLAADPAYAEDLARMRRALDEQLSRIDDLSEIPEAELVARFNTFPEQPVTEPPETNISECRLYLEPVTTGSSLAWRQPTGGEEQAEEWHLYTGPVDICDLDQVEIRAVRYGWQASEAVLVSEQ